MKKVLVAVLLIFAGTLQAQTNLYVDSTIAAGGTGISWTSAYKNLSDALKTVNTSPAATKFVIHVARGTYYPTGSTNSYNRDSTFLVAHDGVKLLGGYPAGGGPRNSSLYPVKLSGNIGSAIDSADNSYHVMVVAGITTSDTVLIDGFNISSGTGDLYLSRTYNSTAVSRNQGAGLYVGANTNRIYILNCRFEHNFCSGYASAGAGVFASGEALSSLTVAPVNLIGCTFNDNEALRGGGASLIYKDCTYAVSNCSFSNNRATIGGGLYNELHANGIMPCILTLSNNTFINNVGSLDGGGIFSDASSTYGQAYPGTINVSGCSFSGNTAAGDGGGVLSAVASPAIDVNYDSCTFSGNSANAGGGIHFKNGNTGSANNTLYTTNNLRNSLFLNNTALTNGGAFNIDGFTYFLNVKGCRFEQNSAVNGGAISLQAAQRTTFDSCRITGNSAVRGGGIYGYFTFPAYTLPTVKRCIISANTASFAGGGVYSGMNNYFGIESTLISGNRAAIYGGAICDSAANSVLVNCTLSGDSAVSGRGIYNRNNSNPTIINSVIWEGGTGSIFNEAGCTPSVTYSTVQGGYPGTGNSAADPQFINPLPASAAPAANGDYQLRPCSPAIDAGTGTGFYAPGGTDLLGRPRLNGAAYDQGAYEYRTYHIDGSDTVCVGKVAQLSAPFTGGSWSSTNSAVAMVSASGLVTPLAPGVDTLVYSISGGCPVAITKRIVVSPFPVLTPISGPGNICMHSAVIVTNATNGGRWVSTNPASATINNSGLLTPVAAGATTVYYVLTSAGGCADSVSKTITVDPLDTSVTQAGAQLTANQHGAIYQWIDCANGYMPVAGQTSQAFIATTNGQYAVIVTLGACSDTSGCFTVSGLQVPDLQRNHAVVQLYPNPASGRLTVESNRIPSLIILNDLTGKQLQAVVPVSTITTFELRGLSSGVYLLECLWEGEKTVKRINVIH